jgi:hypothetical protein
MSSIRRHKISHKRAMDALVDTHVYGDDPGYASLISNAVAELAKTGGAAASQYQAAEAAKKKADADKKAYAAAHADEKAALDAAAAARKQAVFAQIEAQQALAQADAVEKDPNGPQHTVARDAAKKAALVDAAAKAAEAKAAFYKPTTAMTVADDGRKGRGSSVGSALPPWLPWVLGGVGVIGAGFIGYKLLAKGK